MVKSSTVKSIILILILIGGLTTSFYLIWLRPRLIVKKCTFKPLSLGIHSYNGENVVFKLIINVSNPDWQQAVVEPLTFNITQAGSTTPIARCWTDETYIVPAEASFPLTLYLEVYSVQELNSFLESLLTSGMVNVSISGYLNYPVVGFKMPISISQPLKVGEDALKKTLLESIRLASVDVLPPGTKFNVTVLFSNPLDIPLNVSSFTLNVFNLEGDRLFNGNLSNFLTVPPLGKVYASILVDADKSGVEWLLGKIMSGEDVGLKVFSKTLINIYALQLSLNLNFSRFFHPPWGMFFKLNQTVPTDVKVGLNTIAFTMPIYVRSPLECNISLIRFELYDRMSVYMGFGEGRYEPPVSLQPHQDVQLLISMNLTLPAFRSLLVQSLLGETIELQLKEGFVELTMYETTYRIRFERESLSLKP